MNSISSQQLADILGVPIVAGRGDVIISVGVSTDTRQLALGCVFFALRGENFNADTFAVDALGKGAVVAVVHEWQGKAPTDTAVIVVPDTLRALQKLASWWRIQLDIPIIAITGSNGKTSTKDFTAAVLAQRFNVSATRGNLNNHIGLPLSILETTKEHTVAVWEMGMNHPGEIAPLCNIAQPQYGIITNIGTAHIEFLGSREAIAIEKGALARALPTDGFFFIPKSCEWTDMIRQDSLATMITVESDDCPVRAENLRFGNDVTNFTLVVEDSESVKVSLPVLGRHMVTNALLAAAVGWKLGISPAEIAAGLSSTALTSGRLGRYDSRGVTVIDDTYNANPESMAAAIETLSDTPISAGARRIIVLGRMGELGVHALAAHVRTGALASEKNLTVIAVGEGAEGIANGAGNAPYFSDLDEAAEWLKHEVKSGDVVLFKGSRTATVERVMHAVFPKP